MFFLRLAGFAALSLGAGLGTVHQVPRIPPLNVLIVGGGPNPKNNEVAIESNVRYVHSLLPNGSWERILFADGDRSDKTVQCLDGQLRTYYRAPDLPRLDGPSKITSVKQEVSEVAATAREDASPVLLYFTGHGSPNESSEFQNNNYDLWSGGEYTVQDMAAGLKQFPANTPITVVMVECFSGSFGNALFDSGDPDGELSNREICGFFASTPIRMAAGCTPEVNEADYKDFTGYFFAALTGKDRMGRPTTGADYNHDGKIGMNEAFAYALIHDESIDTPVCTSDVFLRRFITITDPQVMATPYSEVLSWATPAQAAALEALSADLRLTGDRRLDQAYGQFLSIRDPETADLDNVRLIRFVRLGKSVVLAHVLAEKGSPEIKRRYQELVRQESSNPLEKTA